MTVKEAVQEWFSMYGTREVTGQQAAMPKGFMRLYNFKHLKVEHCPCRFTLKPEALNLINTNFQN